jgi:proteasome lid subunit RPN8/RPN11
VNSSGFSFGNGAGVGKSAKAGSRLGGVSVDVSARFEMAPEVAHRFNTYAAFAYPYEIGGLLRIQQPEPGVFRAVDLKVFEQRVTGAYFELDEMAVARFTMELMTSGRENEIEEWKSLIHSHPSMTPQMSGTDRENIELLAGQSFAFSVICSAQQDPTLNYYAVHYCQASPAKMIVHNLDVATDRGASLSGIHLVDSETFAAIQTEVGELCTHMEPAKVQNLFAASRSDAVTAEDENADSELSDIESADDDADVIYTVFDSGSLTDEEYEICDTALFMLADERGSGYENDEIESLRTLLTEDEGLTEDESLMLADSLGVFCEKVDDAGETEIAAGLRTRLEDAVFAAVQEDADDSSPSWGSAFSADDMAFSTQNDYLQRSRLWAPGGQIRSRPVAMSAQITDFRTRQVHASALKAQAKVADAPRADQLMEVVHQIASMEELSEPQMELLAQALEAEVRARTEAGRGQALETLNMRDALADLRPADDTAASFADTDVDVPLHAHPLIQFVICACADDTETVAEIGEPAAAELLARVTDSEPLDDSDVNALQSAIRFELKQSRNDGKWREILEQASHLVQQSAA